MIPMIMTEGLDLFSETTIVYKDLGILDKSVEV